jgi:hypothetical protein
MPLSPLGQQLIELIKNNYLDDYARACRLACAIEGQSVSLEEALRLRLHAYRRYDLAGFGGHGREFEELNKIWEKSIEHFADVFRTRMGGRIEGTDERKRIEPDLVQPEALRFDPDQLVLDKGKLVFVDVRVAPAPQILPCLPADTVDEERRRKDRERKRRQRARAKTSRDVPVTSADVRVTTTEPPGPKPGSKSAKDQASEIAVSILNSDAPDRPPRGYGRMIALARLVQPKLAQRYDEGSIRKMISASVREWEEQNPDK